MKRHAVTLLIIAGALFGCAQNHFNVPVENFAEKVQLLGVAPIFTDADSDIIFPQKELLIPLISDLNRKYEPLFVRKLQGTGNFFAVTLLPDEPQKLFGSLIARREKRDDAGIQYNKYFWKNDEIGAYIKKNRLDALLVIVVSGLTKTSKIYSSTFLTSLETNYDFLIMTAHIVGPDGTVLWEYPNFRGRLLPFYPLINLQYPDFSESEANQSQKTEVRFKTLDGIRRTLEQKKSDLLFRETQEPEVYGRLFDEMTSLIKYSIDKQAKKDTAVSDKPLAPPTESQKPGAVPGKPDLSGVPPKPAVSVSPSITAPAQAPQPKRDIRPLDIPAASPDEIVPATESTR